MLWMPKLQLAFLVWTRLNGPSCGAFSTKATNFVTAAPRTDTARCPRISGARFCGLFRICEYDAGVDLYHRTKFGCIGPQRICGSSPPLPPHHRHVHRVRFHLICAI